MENVLNDLLPKVTARTYSKKAWWFSRIEEALEAETGRLTRGTFPKKLLVSLRHFARQIRDALSQF